MKKIINDPTTWSPSRCEGFAAAHADLVDGQHGPDFIVRADAPVAGKVGLVSGGGSGTSRCTAGSSGRACSTPPCPGAVFTSPTPDQMLAATLAVNCGAGVVHIVKNYTGDVLNFEIAAELAAAEGIEVEHGASSTTTSPCRTRPARPAAAASAAPCWWRRSPARPPSAATTWPRWRRSRSGSTSQRPLDGRGAHRRARSRTPGEPSFDLAEDEMEIGIGIHGEPGRRPCAAWRPRTRSSRRC